MNFINIEMIHSPKMNNCWSKDIFIISKVTLVSWLICCLLHLEMAMNIPKPFISTSLACHTYHKKNGRTTKRVRDDCIFGNACCYSIEYISKWIMHGSVFII